MIHNGAANIINIDKWLIDILIAIYVLINR